MTATASGHKWATAYRPAVHRYRCVRANLAQQPVAVFERGYLPIPTMVVPMACAIMTAVRPVAVPTISEFDSRRLDFLNPFRLPGAPSPCRVFAGQHVMEGGWCRSIRRLHCR